MEARLARRQHAYKSTDPAARREARAAATASVRKERRYAHKAKRRNLCSDSTDMEMDQEVLKELPGLISGIRNPTTVDQRLQCLQRLRLMLAARVDPPVNAVVSTGIVRDLLGFLRCYEQPQLQYESAWAITNIVSDREEHTQMVVSLGGIQVLVEVLGNAPDDGVREQAVWALGNIAGDGAALRDAVVEAGFLPPLFRQMGESTPITMLRNATWALANVCRGQPELAPQYVDMVLPWLSRLVNNEDVEVISDALWGMAYLSNGRYVDAIVNSGACRKIVHLLMNNSLAIKTPAVRIIGNLLAGSTQTTQLVLNLGVLPCLLSLITHFSYDSVCKEACWAIANIAAGSEEQIEALMAANIIPPLIVCMSRGNFDVQQEAAWAVSNICTGGKAESIRYLVGQGCIRPLCDLLGSVSATTVSVALDSLEHILMVGQMDNSAENVFAGYIEIAGGKEKIAALVDGAHNAENATKALDILIRFYDKRNPMAMAEQSHMYRAHEQQQQQQAYAAQGGVEPNYFASSQAAAMPQHEPFNF
mmetsp:Transcript_2370/g.8435  ORF Transcript_2370/g.8435 Transcript_2370/m.8435 type:complete len:534 (-) Transcript_2370:42-1643(-)